MRHDPDTNRLIRERAFHIWLEQGQPHGRDREHWLQAEAELASGTAPPVKPELEDKGEGQAPGEKSVAGGNNPDDLRR